MTPVPDGFQRLELGDGVMDGFAPVYFRLEANWRVVLGFRVDSQHCNGRGNCHGGTWATMADVLMGLSVGAVTGLSGPTISMSLHYLAAAPKGEWVEGRAEIIHFNDEMGFAECTFTVAGEAALQANAIFRRRAPLHDAIRCAMESSDSGSAPAAP